MIHCHGHGNDDSIFIFETEHITGLKSHPGHEIAKKQMKMFGGMIAFEVKGGLEPARNLIEVPCCFSNP